MSLRQQILQDTPSGYWPLDETSGTTAFDRSGNGRNLTYVGTPSFRGASPVPGQPSVSFSGGSFAGAAFTGFGLISQFAAEAWIFPTAREAAPYIESILGNDTDLTERAIVLRLGYGGLIANQGKPDALGVNATSYIEAQSPTVIALDTRAHIFLRCDGTTLFNYVNGVVVASTAWTGTASFDTTGDGQFCLGASDLSNAVPRRFWQGGLGGCAIYNHDVVPDRIKAHYEAGIRSGVAF